MKQVVFLAVIGIATLTWAQGPDGFRRMGPRPDVAFTALDADGDGKLSAAEIEKAAASLAKLDKNGDGKLTEDELRPNFGPGGWGRPGGFEGRGGPGGPGGERREDLTETPMAFDRDGDGKLTKSEVPERMQALFGRADADKDGVLTKEELQKAAAAQRAPGEAMTAGRAGPRAARAGAARGWGRAA